MRSEPSGWGGDGHVRQGNNKNGAQPSRLCWRTGVSPNTVHFGHAMASQVSGRMPGPPVARAFGPPPFFATPG